MKYNFSSVTPRYFVGSKKWNEIHEFLPGFAGDIVPFSVADMEFENAPEIREGLKAYIDKYILGYADPTKEFKDAVCSWMERRHNWHVKPEWILSSTGVIKAFYTAIRAFTKPGEGVMLMTPIYYPMYTAIEKNNRKLVKTSLVNLDGRYEVDWMDFEEKAKEPNTKLLILCSPHNPCGRVWTREELQRIGRICIDNGVIICSDEIHFDIVMPGYQHTVFASISEEFAQHSIICTAPSKTFNLAGMQTSNIIIPNKELREEFRNVELTECINPKCNILGYEANRIAYEECENWLEECLTVINKNRLMVEAFMEKEFPAVKITPLEGTYLLWMDFNALGIDYRDLAKLLREEAQLFFDDGYIFGDEGKGFERWNLACPTRYIEEGLERMKIALSVKK
ncbi:cystathionine beta-lyase PatB [Clostridium homopropionicum DSM 5847]|uniref:cysteine-S-conjugate beta-lyase n=1 Tax=Clostridium homopropionicum DSM 5847 TaxID=1121318 RepID=A0A0L6ZCX5_9CLOT|nr:MalY/PatB family protein [Clostridium homopropionicum]KOA20829.1 cystathionine beta-lyase PatB [Clostridium homopropionicum DSM 5847]SFF88072.1 cystathione beta-lyase [Clostridium homopropionicum]